MNLPIFSKKNVTARDFVKFWSRQYFYADENLYDENIKGPLNAERITILFVWKNGRPLSSKKKRSVAKNYIKSKLAIPTGKNRDELVKFLSAPGGTIWRIFWLHCNDPDRFPIYDQHVHRAMAKIQGEPESEIPNNNKGKIIVYLDEYISFRKKFAGIPHREVDKALWAYGKFLRLGYDI